MSTKSNKTKTTIGATPSQDSKTTETTPAPAALIIPADFSAHEKGMTEGNLRFAIELGAKFPGIVSEAAGLKAAAQEADASLERMGQKYYGFCAELRKAKMNRREASLLMAGLGFNKVRRSEILKVSEVSELVWAQFKDGKVSFKGTLALGRDETSPLVPDTEGRNPGDEGYEETHEKREVKKKKERRLAKEFQPSIVACLEDWGDSLKETSAKEPYVMRYENKEKRLYIVTIQPIDASE